MKDLLKLYGNDDYLDEVSATFFHNLVTCYITTKEKKIIGFASRMIDVDE